MKNLRSLVGSAVLLAVLTGCAEQSINNLPVLPETQQPQQSQIQSKQGLTQFYGLLNEVVFNLLDKNKDKRVTLDEFKNRGPLVPQGTLTPAPGSDAEKAIKEDPNAAPVSLEDAFKKMDKNKDGKLTLTDARNNAKLFLGADKNQVRAIVAKPMFDKIDVNKNKSISEKEYLDFVKASGLPQEQAQNLVTSLLIADANKDGNLSLNEFEDVIYSSFRASFLTPVSAPPAPPSQPTDPNPAPPTDPAPPAPPADTPTQPDPAQPAPPAPGF